MARKKEISDRCMAYLQLLTQETSAVEQNTSSRDGKKEDRKEEVTEVSMIQVMFGFCLPGHYSLVFINERHQLDSGVDLFFKRVFGNCAGASERSTLKISTCYSADSVSRPHIISASNFVFLTFGC